MSAPPPKYSASEPGKGEQINREYELEGEGEDHELQGLLSGVDASNLDTEDARRNNLKAKARVPFEWFEDDSQSMRKRKHLAILAIVFVLLLLGAALIPPYISRGGGRKAAGAHPNSHFVGSELRSNGTHDFKRTVLIVSIDGLRCVSCCHIEMEPLTRALRAEYLDRGLTPHLLEISKKGLRAKYMKPIFPVRRISIVFLDS